MIFSFGDSFSNGDAQRRRSFTDGSEPTEPMSRPVLTDSATKPGKDECHAALAQVNLLRVRKQLDDAAQLCETAIQQWPYRADAHALLGDIYQETGRIDDAILRYCRVLELDPANRANRKKMADMVRAKRQQLGPIGGRSQHMPPRFDRLIRVVVLALATLMLVTITAAPLVLKERQTAAELAATGTTVDRRINLSPIVLQPTPPQPVTGDIPDNSEQQTPSLIRDPVEEALVDLMSSDTELLQQGIQVLNAEEDPLTQGFSITFLDRPIVSGADTRADILQNCLRVALSANMRLGSRDTKALTIRCILLSSPTQSADSSGNVPIEATTSLVFSGTIQRNALPAANFDHTEATADQLQPYFTDVWWGTGEE